MSGTRKTYDREFKIQAVKMVLDQGRPVSSVAKSLGISVSVLHSWKHKYLEDSGASFTGHGKMNSTDAATRELKAQLARVTQERDILKKAMAYFAQPKR